MQRREPRGKRMDKGIVSVSSYVQVSMGQNKCMEKQNGIGIAENPGDDFFVVGGYCSGE